MNAQEARNITNENLKGSVIKPYIECIDRKIERAAIEGKSSLHRPEVGAANGVDFYLTGAELKAVKEHYIGEGYEWIDNPDPDPGHPCSGAYTTLSW